MKTRQIFAIAIALTGASLHATVTNIKFGDNIYSGSGVTGTGTYWNYFSGNSGSTLSSLQDSNGGSSDVSIQANYGSRFGGSSVVGSTPDKLLGSGIYGPFSFTISGLAPSESYSIYIFLYDKAGHSTTTTISGLSSASQTPTDSIVISSFNEGGNYLLFSDIHPSALGQITGSSSVSFGGLNGMQIQQIPEPSTVALLLGSVSLVCIINRRRRSLTKRYSE